MKIAVSSQGSSLDSPFEPRFGRAPGFVIFDTETQSSGFLDNAVNQNLPQGAGVQTAQMIVGHGVQVLVTGSLGPKASQALAASSLEVVQLEPAQASTVHQALQAYQGGQAEAASDAGRQAGPAGSRGRQGEGTGRGAGGGGGQGGGRGMGGGRGQGGGRGRGGCRQGGSGRGGGRGRM